MGRFLGWGDVTPRAPFVPGTLKIAELACARQLGSQRGCVRRQRQHVVRVQIRNYLFHESGGGAGVLAGLKSVELARDIQRMKPREPRYVAQALEPVAVA